NYKDSKMEILADKGNGNYAYIDGLPEARKVLVDQATGLLVTIAKDVKIQVEFNPAKVGAYRLIGYANRMLKARDFNDDTKDAGEIGAGHTVTALYEILPPGVSLDGAIDDLKYQSPESPDAPEPAEEVAAGLEFVENDELFTLKLRYKLPDADESIKIEIPVIDEGGTLDQASDDFKFASAVASFGMVLRDSVYKGDSNFDLVLELAIVGSGELRLSLEAIEFLEDFVQYTLTANVELAQANANALLERSDLELALALTRSSVHVDRFRKATKRAMAIPELAEVAAMLDERMTTGLNFLARVRMPQPQPTYRSEFIDLVRMAKQLGSK
ncbi:MAG: DUF3520 domain-containing protein, partial [Planctomycetota bacterium]|nr:DUF3520 domain-containing protein [Planctomycetota bacterium]